MRLPIPVLINHQLFAEAYLSELSQAKTPLDIVDACRQTILEWREEYPSLDQQADLMSYIAQCLSALGFSYQRASHPDHFVLFADETHSQPLGVCLTVTDEQIGRMIKGCHHQARLVKLLKEQQLAWGMVSNGRDWRLCYAKSPTPYEIYLEANLDALLDPLKLQEFVQFYQFFRRESFAFQPLVNNRPAQQVLDIMLADSEASTQAIERHLKNRVDDILQALCMGFVDYEGSGELARADLDEIYHNAISLLYRTLFLFYAEARQLLPVDNDIYRRNSLEAIVEDAHHWQIQGVRNSDPYSLWRRLANLCGIVDLGDQESGVSPYNGGLFSDAENPYLRDHRIRDDYLAPAVFYLAYLESKTGLRRIEYRDLSVRHLGTLYEGMLEYRLNLVKDEPVVVRESKGKRIYIPQSIANPKKGETILQIGRVYFADDKGERKSSGSYYTPEDVVQYIVNQTLMPKLEELAAPLQELIEQANIDRQIAVTPAERTAAESHADRQAQTLVESKLLSLKILDPTMGSAHFLVAAGQMLTNFIVEQLNNLDWPSEISTDPLLWKRRVVERCLYGVDVNPLAQELAKLSLWLSSASAGKPLTFLDHHLKVGNSLYGAPLIRLSVLPNAKVGNYQQPIDMFNQLYQRTLQDMLDEFRHITDTDSEHIEDIKGKGEAYAQACSLSQHLRVVADVWLATLFGLTGEDEKPVNDSQYLELLQEAAKDYTLEKWEATIGANPLVLKARRIASQHKFFHWELEFPDVVKEERCQFDLVIANPPYVGTPPTLPIMELYETAKCGDLYAWIFERGLLLLEEKGFLGTIIPLSIIFAGNKRTIRAGILKNNMTVKLVSCDNTPDSIFGREGYNRQRTTIVIAQKTSSHKQIFSTTHLRWASYERPMLFSKLRFANTTRLCNEDYFPMVDDDRLVEFFLRLLSLNNFLGDIISVKKSYFLCVPSVACYFVSAVPVNLQRRNQEILWFEDYVLQQYAFGILNSNVFYWYWRSRSDGFWVSREQILGMPVPKKEDVDVARLLEFSRSLWQGAEIENSKKMGNKQTKNYYFNRRMDILLDIDAWIMEHVAPDLNLPKDIFAQYKSNSFLRPLDYLNLIQTEEPEGNK